MSLCASLFGTLLLARPASAQIQGYGKDATGGAAGSVCTVTASTGTGAGTFHSCLSKGGNQTIQFAVPSITLSQIENVSSNTTIDGCANGQTGVFFDQTGGPSRNVLIDGPATNVIVRCIRFQGPGGSTEGSDLLSLDGTDGQITKIAVDRCTFVAAADGGLDMTGDVSDVTVQQSLFYGTELTELIKYNTRTRFSIHHNVYTAGGERNPQIKGDATKFELVSNVVYNNNLTVDSYGTLLWNANSSSDSIGNVQANLIANAYVGTNGTISITTESGASAAGIYIAPNNFCSPASNCPASPASSPFTVAAGYGVTPTLPGCMAANMLPTVGAPNRTTTDQQKIAAVAAVLPNSCSGGTTPSLSINDVSVTEGNSGTTAATFTVTLSAAATSAVTVNFATANGTATAGSDYVATSGTLTFPAGTTTKTIAVTVNGDTVVEPNETFTVNLSTPAGATIADAQGVGTIVNDDSLPALSIGDVSVTEGNSGTKPMTFTVTLSAAAASPVSVTYATANGTATAPSDYAATAGTLTFPAGSTSQTFTVLVNGDTTAEPNEAFTLNLSAASGATIARAQATGTILNDDIAAGGAQPVVWTSLVNVAAAGNALTDLAASGTNAGAVSTRKFTSGDGYVEFTASETTTYRMAGLSTGNPDASYNVAFGIVLAPAGQVFVAEKAVSRGTFGTYGTGDVFRIAVVNGAVKYSRNGAVFYSSTQAPTYPLLVDTWLYSLGATLKGVVFTGAQ